MKARLIVSLFLLFSFSSLNAQNKIILREGIEQYSIGKYLLIYKDDSKLLTIDQIASGNYDKKFFKSDKDILDFSVNGSTFWIKIIVDDSSITSQDWYLKLDYPITEDVIFYKKTGAVFLQKQSGARFPFTNREFKIPTILFRLPINYGEVNIYYLQISGGESKVIPLELISAKAFVNDEVPKSFFKGGFYGILAIMIVYNLFLFLSVKDKTYLYYVLYVLSYTIYQFSYEGYSFQYFWEVPINVAWFLTLVSLSSISIAWLLLSREFLQTKTYVPKTDYLLKALIASSIIILLLSFIQSVHINTIIATINIMVIIVVGFIVAIIAYRNENKSALFYLLAVTGTLFGIFVRGLRTFGFIDESLFTQNILQYGILWEVSILSFALGNRINTIKAEKEKEKALIRSNIAADLHDEIGSNLSSISMLGQLINQKISTDDEVKSLLDKISDTAKESSESIRDIVWFINPSNDTSETLVTRIKDCAYKLLSGINYKFNMPENIFESVNDLKARRQIFFILKEAITNAAKHSHASIIEITAEKNDKILKFVIKDNGVGIDEINTTTGNGFINMKKRAEQIKAKLKIIQIEKNAGTEVELTLT